MTPAATALPEVPPAPAVLAGPPMLAVISNGGSTQNRRQRNWIDPYLASETNVRVLRTSGPDDIGRCLRDAAAAKAEIVVVNGGDGTADLVFGALLNERPFVRPPAVALLAAGKTNMTAAAWCGGGDKAAALQRLLHLRRMGTLLDRAVHRSILTVERGDGSSPLRGAFFGAAEAVDGILFCRRRIYPLNLPNAVSHGVAIGLLLWRSLVSGAGAKPISVRWDDAGEESGSFFFVGATTLGRLIVGLKPRPDVGIGPVTYLSLRTGPAAVLAAVPRLVAKTVASGIGRCVRRVDTLHLAFDGAYTLDGELYEARRDRPLVISARETLPIIRLGEP
jgi:hypothetical protein